MSAVHAVRRALLAASILCVLFPCAASAATHDSTEASIVRAINAVRARAGVAALHRSRGLARAADAHSAAMLRTNTLSHGAMGQRVRHYVHARGVGENLAWLTRCNAAQVVRMWLNSAAHRRVMLSPSFRRVGVAARSTSTACFVTADFGTAT
jgi:uncharacterized protein YkwD